MANYFGTRGLVGIGLLGLAIASTAAAVPLNYTVIPAESNASVRMNVGSTVNVSPDLTENILDPVGAFPVSRTLTANTNTQPGNLSKLTADVGIPNFNNGANGIDISVLELVYFQAPGSINLTGGPLPAVPVDLSVLPVAPPVNVQASVIVTSLKIVLDAPLTSSLTPSINPNEWLWAGLASATISGLAQPSVSPGTALPAGVPSTPFSQQVSLPLVGNFQVLPDGTRVNVGIQQTALQNQNLSLPPISQQYDVGDLGLITLTFDISNLVLADISSSVVFKNATVIPEPGTAALLAVGLVGVALQRRRVR